MSTSSDSNAVVLAALFEKYGSFGKFGAPTVTFDTYRNTEACDTISKCLCKYPHTSSRGYSNIVYMEGLMPFNEFINMIAPHSDKAKRHAQAIGLSTGKTVQIKLTLDDAVIPFKTCPSDVGYDLTLVRKVKDVRPNVILYDTGLQIKPPEGYYTEIVPRSSIIKTGWVLANSVGIIDRDYRGNLMVAVARVDPQAPEFELPHRGFQLILRKQETALFQVLKGDEDWEATVRGDGGFGSTGQCVPQATKNI